MLRRIATNATALAVGGGVAQLAFISIEIAIARQLGQEDYGIFATVQAIALALLIVLDLGMTWWMIESGSRKPQGIPELLGTTFLLKLAGFAVLYPLAAWGLALLGYDKPTINFFLIFFVYSLTMAIQDTLSAAFTARQRMIVNAVFQGAAPLLIAALVVPVLLLGFGLPGVGVAFVAGGLLVAIVWGVMTWRAEHPRVRLSASLEILRGSYLYGLTGLLVHLFRKGDILVLSVLASMPEVGIYAAGAKLLDLAYKIPMVAALAASPTLFQQNQSDDARYRRTADAFFRFGASLGLLVAVACFHSAEWLIHILFGPAYQSAAIVLQVLSASFALKFIAYALQTVLTTRGQHGWRTGMLAVSTGLAGIGYFTLIPRFGAVGAAISVVVAEILLTCVYLYGIGDVQLRAMLTRRLATAGFAGALSVAAPFIFGLDGPAASSLGLLVGLAALIVTGYVQPGELATLRDKMTTKRDSRP